MYPMSAHSTAEEFKNRIEAFVYHKVWIITVVCCQTMHELFRLKTWSSANFQAFPLKHLLSYNCNLSRKVLRKLFLFW